MNALGLLAISLPALGINYLGILKKPCFANIFFILDKLEIS
jgi:hypothetical protein